jgi:hypothetical protein
MLRISYSEISNDKATNYGVTSWLASTWRQTTSNQYKTTSDSSPSDFPFRPFCQIMDYDKVGWLFLSSRPTSNLELQSLITLELLQVNPE